MLTRRSTLALVLSLPSALSAACAGPSGAGEASRHDAHTFYATTSFSGASFAHDG